MDEQKNQLATIDEYISGCPQHVQPILSRIRVVIREAAPQATERISYGMPCLYLNGNLVYFGAGKNHIGFYPTAAGIEAFKDEFAGIQMVEGRGAVPAGQAHPL